MSRTIKFRAWGKETRTMYNSEVSDLLIHFDGELNSFNKDGDIVGVRFTKQLELMQYTGLKDLNSKEIYEGDIVKALNKNGWSRRFEIMWIEDCARFKVWNGSQPNISFDLTCDTIIDFRVEVIGDIYTTPELREVSE